MPNIKEIQIPIDEIPIIKKKKDGTFHISKDEAKNMGNKMQKSKKKIFYMKDRPITWEMFSDLDYIIQSIDVNFLEEFLNEELKTLDSISIFEKLGEIMNGIKNNYKVIYDDNLMVYYIYLGDVNISTVIYDLINKKFIISSLFDFSVLEISYLKILEKKKKNLSNRIKILRRKRITPSIEGMLVQSEQQLNSISEYLQKPNISEKQEEMIKILLRRGYKWNKSYYSDIEQPEFIKGFTYKQVRVCVNFKGIMVLLDSGAGLQLTKGNLWITPNAERLDYLHADRDFMNTAINYFEKRANNKELNEKIIQNYYDDGYI